VIEIRQARLMIDWRAGTLDGGCTAKVESSMTKVAVSESLFGIVDRRVQDMSGDALSGNMVVAQTFREIRVWRNYDCPTKVHRWSTAKRTKRDASAVMRS